MKSQSSPYSLRLRQDGKAVTASSPSSTVLSPRRSTPVGDRRSTSGTPAQIPAPRALTDATPVAGGWWRVSLRTHLLVAALYRIALVALSEWYDARQAGQHAVRYTDIDYIVFTDAARQVLNVSCLHLNNKLIYCITSVS